MPSPEDSPGHRKRLRDKFLRSGLKGFHDYEIVELLLTLGSPRRDCKPAAKAAIKRFKTLRGVLSAPPDELQKINGIGPQNAFGISLVLQVAREFLKENVLGRMVYKSSREIFDYLYHSMRDLKNEVPKVIYLDGQNRVIEITDLAEGTVNASSIFPREVMTTAVKHGATSLVFVHNHPSGDPEPSASDRALTRDLVYAGRIMQVKVLDHIIIGDNTYYSFAGEGLIEEYETDYLNLKLQGTSEAKRRMYRTRTSSQ